MNPYCRLFYLEICSESVNRVWCHFQQSNIPRSSLGIDRWIRNSSDSNAFRSISQQEQHDDVISGAGTARLSDVHTAVSNVQSLVFCSIFGCSLFVFFVFWPLHYRFNLQLLMSPFISSNVFLMSSWHYFSWKLLKHSDVAVRGVNIGLCIPNKW
jgi:hypothetical protein